MCCLGFHRVWSFVLLALTMTHLPAKLEAAEIHLKTASTFFSLTAKGSDRSLEGISVGDVQEYVSWLARRSNGRGGTLSPSSQRKYLNSLSNLYRRAISERRVPLGYNPVASLLEKPQEGCGRGESKWLEVHEAALLLAYAHMSRPKRLTAAISPATLHAILATMLLTGGRPSEVLGLQRRDVSFERKLITFQPNSVGATLSCGDERQARHLHVRNFGAFLER